MGWKFLDFTGLSHFFGKLPEKVVTTDTTQTISGTKSFSSTILGSVSGSAASAAKDGSGNVIADTYETKADAATHLSKSDAAGTYLSKTDATSTCVQTAAVDQTIAGTKTFSKPIAGSVTGSSGSCTGNAATATQFSANATVALTGDATGTSAGSKKGWSVPVTLANSGVTAGSYGPNAAASPAHGGTFSVPYVTVDAKGRVTAASTITITLPADSNTDTLMTQNVSTTNATYPVLLCPTANATSNQGAKTGIFAKSVKINPSTNVISASGFSGPLTGNVTGNVTGNCSGSSGSCTGNAATATTATTAKSCTGNAATATKLAAKRTIALSGAATGTATDFDGSGNITIPVTALSGSAITSAITVYDLVPDGPEAHNAMWGGRDITAAFDAGTVSEHIADGTFKDIFPGDYITKQVTISGTAYTVNWVVADCDYWLNKGDQNNGMETHHVVIVPQAPIFNANMNNDNVTTGGYAGSRMYRETIPACATGIVNAFGASHILTFRDWLISGMTANQISSGLPNFTGGAQWGASPWVSVQCDLMTEKMVLGAPVNSASALDEWCATRQFSAFRLSEKLINYNRQSWWLRNIVSSASFADVYGGGGAGAHYASHVLGVRPFALLK